MVIVNSDAVSPAASSTWTTLWSGTARMLRRSSMPMAWIITLTVCAGSAFAVRDVVFPSLAPSASPSLWQPQPGDSTTSILRVTSTADRIAQSTALPTTELVVPVSEPGVDSVQDESQSPATSSGRQSSGGSRNGATPMPTPPTTSKPQTSTSTASSGPTTSAAGDHATSTTTDGATSTSSPASATTVTATTDPGTTDPVTADTLPVNTGGTSGSGRGGTIDDRHP